VTAIPTPIRAIEGGFGDLFNQEMGLAVHDAVALLNRRAPNGSARWLLPVPSGPGKNASSRC
jgi:hypothetical protein